MCCTRFAGNTGRKNRQKFAIWAPSHNFVGLYLRNYSIYGQSEKIDRQQYLLHMFPQYGELCPISGWDRLARLRQAPTNFNGFRVLASLLQRRRSTEVNHKLCTMFGRLLAGTVHMHFWGILPPDGILPGAKFTLRPSLAFSCIGSATARHSSNGRQPNCAALRRGCHLYIRQGGHHVGHQPTF